MVSKRKDTKKDDPGLITLCNDMPSADATYEKCRINKKKGEPGLMAFNRFSRDEANAWCASGLCSSGKKCRGQRSKTNVTVFKETANYIEVTFTMTITCKCE